jgi:hypothetical protein
MVLKSGSFLALAASALLSSGCAMQARVDADARQSVAACHTYAFADAPLGGPEGAYSNPLNDKRLREAIAAQLSGRGVQAAADATPADCIVGYAIGSRLAPDPASPRFGWGLGWGGGWGHHWGGSVAWSTPSDVREGRVSVDLFDAHSHQALWHAYVDEDVTRLTGNDAEQRIREVVKAIFAKFPAPAVAPAAPAPGGSRS